jgi:thiazole synthase
MDAWHIDGVTLTSRLLLGSARYPSPDILREAIVASGCQIVTISIRRHDPALLGGQGFWGVIRSCNVRLLPNTAGCLSSSEAITTAHMAREIFGTSWIKLEVIGHDQTLQPDPYGLVDAARELVREGFTVFPYTTEDMVIAKKLVDVGCQVLMPWGSPIGTARGLANPFALKTMRQYFPRIPMIIDAGLGQASHAAQAMELGFDGVLLNTAVALAGDPVLMARAFASAAEAGRMCYVAGPIPARDHASASTPTVGQPFWHQELWKEKHV